MDHGTKVGNELATSYSMCCTSNKDNSKAHEKLVNLGLRLGGFLSDAGWYAESEKVLLACKDLCLSDPQNVHSWCRILDCCHKYVKLIKICTNLILIRLNILIFHERYNKHINFINIFLYLNNNKYQKYLVLVLRNILDANNQFKCSMQIINYSKYF